MHSYILYHKVRYSETAIYPFVSASEQSIGMLDSSLPVHVCVLNVTFKTTYTGRQDTMYVGQKSPVFLRIDLRQGQGKIPIMVCLG